MTRYAAAFRRVARSLSRVELMRSSMDDTFSLNEQELMDKNAGRRFLDFYGDDGLRLGLERYGFTERLRELGFVTLHFETHALDERHTLLIDGTTEDGRRGRLVELVVRRDRLHVEGVDRKWEVLTVDWLTLQNPFGEFTEARLRLPGQQAPGLGMGERVVELLFRVVDRLELDGMLTVAEYFHNATLYARELRFLDPYYAGQLMALEARLFDREKLDLAQAAWAVEWGMVRGPDGAPFSWRGEAMVKARDGELRDHVTSRAHRREAKRVAKELSFTLDREGFDGLWMAAREGLLAPP